MAQKKLTFQEKSQIQYIMRQVGIPANQFMMGMQLYNATVKYNVPVDRINWDELQVLWGEHGDNPEMYAHIRNRLEDQLLDLAPGDLRLEQRETDIQTQEEILQDAQMDAIREEIEEGHPELIEYIRYSIERAVQPFEAEARTSERAIRRETERARKAMKRYEDRFDKIEEKARPEAIAASTIKTEDVKAAVQEGMLDIKKELHKTIQAELGATKQIIKAVMKPTTVEQNVTILQPPPPGSWNWQTLPCPIEMNQVLEDIDPDFLQASSLEQSGLRKQAEYVLTEQGRGMVLRQPVFERIIRQMSGFPKDRLFYELCPEHRVKYKSGFYWAPTFAHLIAGSIDRGMVNEGALIQAGIPQDFISECQAIAGPMTQGESDVEALR